MDVFCIKNDPVTKKIYIFVKLNSSKYADRSIFELRPDIRQRF